LVKVRLSYECDYDTTITVIEGEEGRGLEVSIEKPGNSRGLNGVRKSNDSTGF
jgi:hypothetical protein